MSMSRAANPKQQAHELIDRMSSAQVTAVVGLLHAMIDPFANALANAPVDDEPADEERSSSPSESTISHADVLRDFNLSPEDFERMGRTPLDSGTDR